MQHCGYQWIIKMLAAPRRRRGGVYPHPRSLILVRRWLGWDKPSPYVGCVQHIDYQYIVNAIPMYVKDPLAGGQVGRVRGRPVGRQTESLPLHAVGRPI